MKEYHIGRFKAHFQTDQGKKILGNYLLIIKLIIIPGLIFSFSSQLFSWILILVFSIEAIFFARHLIKRSFRTPVLTKKTFLILGFGFLLEFLILSSSIKLTLSTLYISLLGLDVFAPLIFTGLVLAIEPVAVSWRRKIIEKASKKREKFKELVVIGITGSYGKTSTKEFLAQILSKKFKVLKTKKHQNSEVGVSQCILNDLKPDHQVFVCEMGAYNKGGIKLLAGIARPQIGILTGINQQHLATFGSLENIVKTKYELIASLPSDGLAIFNGENNYCRELFEKTKIRKQITKKDVKVEDVEIGRDFISFRVFLGDESANFKVSLIGGHWLDNISMAILAAKELGMNLKDISRAAEEIRPLPGGMRLIKTPQGLNILDATYSANPSGVISHLDYLKV